MRPKRPYKNLRDFAFSHQDSNSTNWPCLACRGRGTRHEHTVDQDGCFGVLVTKCEDSEGSGEGTKAAVTQAYREAIQEWRKQAEKYDLLVETRKAALKKLSKAEIAALQKLGV